MTYRRLIAAAFVFNGLGSLGVKGVHEFGLDGSALLVLSLMYAVGASASLAYLLVRREHVQMRSLVIGLLAGISSVIGSGCSILAAARIPGYIVFPLTGGGTLVLVALVGRIAFKEKIGPYGIAGILLGIAAIVLLST